MKKEQYIILSLILLSILGSLMYYNTVLVDTQAYVPSVFYVQSNILGYEDVILWEEDNIRVTESYAFKRPVEIVFAALLEPYVGVRQAYSLINVFLYILTSIVTFYYVKRLFTNHQNKTMIGYLAAVLFATSLPVIMYASRVLVDVAGYLILLLGLWFIDIKLEKQKPSWKDHAMISMMIGLFLLVRDPVVILYPYYVLTFLLRKGCDVSYIKRNVIKIWPIIFTVVPQLLFMKYFSVGSLLAGKSVMITAGKYSLLGWIKFFLVHGAAFHIVWILAVVGLWYEIRTYQKGNKIKENNQNNQKRILFFAIFAISSCAYLVGIQLVALTSPRFSMVLFPVLLPLAAYGIYLLAQKGKNNKFLTPITIILCLLTLYACISFFGSWIYPSHALITEDAGANIILEALWNEIKIKMGLML